MREGNETDGGRSRRGGREREGESEEGRSREEEGEAEGWKERAPCSPSDALLKVKVFRPSLVEGMSDGGRRRESIGEERQRELRDKRW
jgi:hypothetical protein